MIARSRIASVSMGLAGSMAGLLGCAPQAPLPISGTNANDPMPDAFAGMVEAVNTAEIGEVAGQANENPAVTTDPAAAGQIQTTVASGGTSKTYTGALPLGLLELLSNNGIALPDAWPAPTPESPAGEPVATPPVATVPPAPAPTNSTPAASFAFSADSFASGGAIPIQHTGDGANTSPALNWSNAPTGTQSFAVIVDDTDANFVHWVIFDIPAGVTNLPTGVPTVGNVSAPAGARQGGNDFGGIGYGGPFPPQGDPAHHYRFTLYALSAPLNLPAGATRADVIGAMSGTILVQAEIVGLYTR